MTWSRGFTWFPRHNCLNCRLHSPGFIETVGQRLDRKRNDLRGRCRGALINLPSTLLRPREPHSLGQPMNLLVEVGRRGSANTGCCIAFS
jgi:hypothetical protein